MHNDSARKILKTNDLRPKKGLGQHFLVKREALLKIITAAELNSKDIVLEIGPGTGILTQELAKRAKKVIAIEKDPLLIPILKENLGEFDNVEVVRNDALEIGNWELIKNYQPVAGPPKAEKLKIRNYKLIANLPYYIATRVIRQFLEAKNPPELMALMVQKEVGQRICAKPPDMSLLAVAVQFYAEAKLIGYVKKTAFWPQPKVDSAIIKIIPKDNRFIHDRSQDKDLFFKIVKAGFSQPRKQLANNLAKKLNISREETKTWLIKNKIRPEQRPETLSVGDWQNLTKTFN